MLTQPNILAAYLYLHLGEQMPEDAPDEWFLEPDPFAVDMDRLERFILRIDQMLNELQELELDPEQDAAPQYMTLVYDAGKDVFDQDKSQLRTFFRWFYLVVYQREEGPRWGDFIEIYGVDNFDAHVRERFGELI